MHMPVIRRWGSLEPQNLLQMYDMLQEPSCNNLNGENYTRLTYSSNQVIQTTSKCNALSPLNWAFISNISTSETLRIQEQYNSHNIYNLKTASSTILKHESKHYAVPCECNSLNRGGQEIRFRQDVQLFYVFNNPFQRLLSREAKVTNNSANCSILCQIQNTKNSKSIFKKLYKTLQSESLEETAKCCDVSNQCRGGGVNADKAMERLVNLLTEPIECKCFTKTFKKKKHRITSCRCAETQSRRYGEQHQRAGRESFYRETGTSGNCTCANKNRNFFRRRYPGFNEPYDCNDNISESSHKCTNPSTRCQADAVQNEPPTFGQIFRKLIEPEKCKRLTYNLKQALPQIHAAKHQDGGVEAQTQFRRYDGRQQRAGRESYCREIGTSGVPVYKSNLVCPVTQECPGKSNYVNDEGLYYSNNKTATVNRRIGSNGGCNMKCCNDVSRHRQELTQSSVYSQLNGINNDGGILKKLGQIILEGSNISPGTGKCCKNRGTFYQVNDDSTLGIFKKYFQLLTEPKTVTQDSINEDNDSTLRKFLHVFQKQIKEDGAGAEATTQSRYYGGLQERAGREVFCRNRGTSGAPKPVCQGSKEEDYEEEIVEEFPTCEQAPPITNKAVGIGTNCKFSLGWYKDRLGYGEPKPQNTIKDLKMTIDEWNEVPLRQTGTKIGASLNADAGFTSYNTNAATQSRKFKGRHLRAGRETFYREQQTSCVPKNKKPIIDGINTNAVPQAIQPPPPDRKSLRLGSDCSFCFEFYKDVPPESPENVRSIPCQPKIESTQNNTSLYSKLIPQWLASQIGERGTQPNKSDACTITEENIQGKEVCECEKNIPKALPRRKPLHIGSNVSYHFNFSKSISPPKVTSMARVPCVRSNKQEETDITQVTQEPEKSSECVDVCVNQNDDFTDGDDEEYVEKTPKEIIKELFTKKTLKRLIKGPPKFDIENALQNKIENKGGKLPPDLKKEDMKAKQFVCKAKCKDIKQLVEKPDQPFRIGSSFSFDYNMHKLMPKQEKKTYEEKFPQLEDFSGSPFKMNVFRFIVGKIRKRVKKKTPETRIPVCPEYRPWWLSLIVSGIKRRRRRVATSCETETKKFFTDILSTKSSKSSKSTYKKLRRCPRRKLGIGREFMSYFLANLKDIKSPESENSCKSFISQMLSKKTDPSRRRRRRRRGSKAGSQFYFGDDILDSSFPESRRTSRKSDDSEPCKITSDCCFKCDYSTLDDTTDDTQSASTNSSRNYGTT